MYLPPHYGTDDPDVAWQLASEHPFGLLMAGEDVTPLPWLLDAKRGVLRSHLAAANPMSAAVDGERATVVFQGPDGYVSPTWYREPRQFVPTWNYAVATFRGIVRRLDRERTRALMWKLCERFEAEGGYRPDWIERPFFEELLDELVGIELVVESSVAKLKLSQNREPEDRARVMAALEAGGNPGLAGWMRRTR
jgi:transcriptional regulator